MVLDSKMAGVWQAECEGIIKLAPSAQLPMRVANGVGT